MAKTKKVKTVASIAPCYYVYYDKSTGSVLSVTNEPSVVYDHRIEITEDEYRRLVTSTEPFSKYQVGYAKSPDGKTALSLIPLTEQGYPFRSNMFEWITDEPLDDTELVVTWNKKEKQWEFVLSTDCKNRVLGELVPSTLVFFVTLETDFDFLIRTIDIPTQELIKSDKVTILFNSKLENNIDNISIATKLLFNTYGLLVND